MPIRFKKGEEGYALEVKTPRDTFGRQSIAAIPYSSWKHVCYLTSAVDLGMVPPWGPQGDHWVAVLGKRATAPCRTRKGAVAAWVSTMEYDLRRDRNRINFIRDAYDARLEGEKLFIEDRQRIVEELRKHFPGEDS